MEKVLFVKWLCNKSKSYQMTPDGFILSIDDSISLCECAEFKEEYKPNYRDLLQEGIEYFIKKKLFNFDLFVDMSGKLNMRILDIKNSYPKHHVMANTIEQVKEDVLKYLYKLEEE